MKIFIFGEAMLEYHSHGGSGLRYGGDTLNTAIHLARLGQDVAYVTAVGTDAISDALVAAWRDEGIDTRHVHRHPTRAPGIYAIHLDPQGERSFIYWRDRSAAREMFSLPEMAATLADARECGLLYFSLISLSVIGEEGRRQLIELARTRKEAGRAVAYDSNYRPSMWSSHSLARDISMAAAAQATIGLPTNVDECQLFQQPRTEAEIARRWRQAGCDEVLVKAGEQGCFHAGDDGSQIAFPAHPVEVIDSSGAGDAFNAGYLNARLAGKSLADSVHSAQEMAAATLGHLGAIRPKEKGERPGQQPGGE